MQEVGILNINHVNLSVKIGGVWVKKEQVTDDATGQSTVSTKQIGNQMRNLVKEMLDPAKGMTDEQKEKYENKIRRKLQNGEKLTGEEMRYLQINNPELFAEASKIQVQRQALETKLKNCKSKQQVTEAYSDAISHVDTKETVAGALMAAFANVLKEFKKTSVYQGLPQKTEKDITGYETGLTKQEGTMKAGGKDATEETATGENQLEEKYFPEKDTFSAMDIGV